MIMGRLGDQECTLMEHEYVLGVMVWKPNTIEKNLLVSKSLSSLELLYCSYFGVAFIFSRLVYSLVDWIGPRLQNILEVK